MDDTNHVALMISLMCADGEKQQPIVGTILTLRNIVLFPPVSPSPPPGELYSPQQHRSPRASARPSVVDIEADGPAKTPRHSGLSTTAQGATLAATRNEPRNSVVSTASSTQPTVPGKLNRQASNPLGIKPKISPRTRQASSPAIMVPRRESSDVDPQPSRIRQGSGASILSAIPQETELEVTEQNARTNFDPPRRGSSQTSVFSISALAMPPRKSKRSSSKDAAWPVFTPSPPAELVVAPPSTGVWAHQAEIHFCFNFAW